MNDGIDVLLTDGGYKQAYAALRNLHAHGLRTAVLCPSPASICWWSRFPVRRIRYSRPGSAALAAVIGRLRPRMVMPVGIGSTRDLIAVRDCLPAGVHALVPGTEAFAAAYDKNRTFALAAEYGLDVPRTYDCAGAGGLPDGIRYPVVVKSADSGRKGWAYCDDPVRAASAADAFSVPGYPAVIQDKVQGEGVGYFGLYRDGEPLAEFMHRRVHEYPVTGGVSACARSHFDPELRDAGRRLLGRLGWNGVAMVEFKHDRDSGRRYLIEINPKYWGSLELGIRSGIEFPYLHYLAATGGALPPVPDARGRDVIFRWLYPFEQLWARDAGTAAVRAFTQELRTATADVYNDTPSDDPAARLFKNLYGWAYRLSGK